MEKFSSERRSFLRGAIAGALALPAMLAGFSQFAIAQAKKLVDPNDPVAKALKYTHDASKAPERKTERQGIKADKQTCANCALYTAQGKVDGKDAGKCTMIQSGLVTAAGWCNSWAKKA